MGIRRRLERLERGLARPCPECGFRPDEMPPVEVVSGPIADLGPKHCGVCGGWRIVCWPEVLEPRGPGYLRASDTGGEGVSPIEQMHGYQG